jgi:F0F1-type ATP synthase alpha subunit
MKYKPQEASAESIMDQMSRMQERDEFSESVDGKVVDRAGSIAFVSGLRDVQVGQIVSFGDDSADGIVMHMTPESVSSDQLFQIAG